jgi:hypothetical protein
VTANNTCVTNTVPVTNFPDLTVTKTNNVSGAAQVAVPFNWVFTITNGGIVPASFVPGSAVLTDDLPTTGATYGTPTNSGGLTCAVTSNTLDCTANGTLNIPAGGTVTITLPVTPNALGSLVNPNPAGINGCAVDPSSNVPETSEINNGCANTVTVTDTTPPTVVSINRAATSPTAAASVTWTVVFSESVTGVDAADFAVANTGLTGSPAITNVTGSATTWTVTGSTGSGGGTLGLNLVDNDTIADTSGNKLGGVGAGNGNFTGQLYTIDHVAPTVTVDQAAAQADPTSASPVNFTVVFSEVVTGFTNADVTISGTAGGTKTVVVTGTGPTYNVAVSGMTTSGTVIASIAAAKATDAVGNQNAASTATDNTVQYNFPTFNVAASAGTGGTIRNSRGESGFEPGIRYRSKHREHHLRRSCRRSVTREGRSIHIHECSGCAHNRRKF